jgi:hypothetical protein
MTMVKISSDLKKFDYFESTHVTPRGLPPRFGRVEKLRHVNLIKNYNDSNVYTDN